MDVRTEMEDEVRRNGEMDGRASMGLCDVTIGWRFPPGE